MGNIKTTTNKFNRKTYIIEQDIGYDWKITETDLGHFIFEFRRDIIFKKKVLLSFTSTQSLEDTIREAGERTYNYCLSHKRYNPSKINSDRFVEKLLIDFSIRRDNERFKARL